MCLDSVGDKVDPATLSLPSACHESAQTNLHTVLVNWTSYTLQKSFQPNKQIPAMGPEP
jgi:hypothetical protein